MTRLVLPLPPSVNHAYRNFTTASGRRMRVLCHEAEQFKYEAGLRAVTWRLKAQWRRPAPDKNLVVRMWVYWKSNQPRDTDNVWKLTLDALKGVLYEDDNMCLPQVMDFAVDRSNPRLELEPEVMA